MSFEIIVNLVIKYLEAHPEVVEKLVGALVSHLADRLPK
jgi:hypothetical protein